MYSDYFFVPLDLPKLLFDKNSLLDFYDTHKTRCIDVVSEPLGHPWNIVWLWERGKSEPNNTIINLFYNFKEILKLLPHYYINNIALLEQVEAVKPHCDVSKEDDETLGASSYRCMLINEEPSKTFYFKKGVRWKGSLENTEIFPVMPENTNFFAINNHNSMHGSYLPTKRKIILTIWGKVDKQKHISLLKQSIKKYKDYCLK